MSCKAVNFTMIIPCCRWGAQTVNSSKLTTSVDNVDMVAKVKVSPPTSYQETVATKNKFQITIFYRYSEAWQLFITQKHKQQLYKIDHALSVAWLSSVVVQHFLVLSSRFKLCITAGVFIWTVPLFLDWIIIVHFMVSQQMWGTAWTEDWRAEECQWWEGQQWAH